MLTILRRNKHNIIFKIIFAVIIISFAAFFGSSGLRQRGGGIESGDAPAVVNGEVISSQRFLSLVDQQLEQYKQIFKDKLPKEFDAGIKKNVINSLIEQALLSQAITRSGLKTSPKELTQYIVNNQQFQQEGSFNLDFYKNRFLPWYEDANGTSFEHDVMQELALEKFIRALGLVQTPNQRELELENIINETRFTFSVVAIPEPATPDSQDTKNMPAEEKANKLWDLWKANKLKKDQLEKYGLQSKDTPAFNYTQLSSVFGGNAGIENLKTVAALTKSKPFPPTPLKEGSQVYLIKLTDLKLPEKTLTDEQKQQLLSQYRKDFADGLAQAYLDELRRHAKIKKHSTLN